MARIIVAGGGHGGIGAAALLAKNGHDVTVYEKHAREEMGYDWTDIFAPQISQPAQKQPGRHNSSLQKKSSFRLLMVYLLSI